MSHSISDKSSTIVNQHSNGYDELILISLLDRLRLEGGQLILDRETRDELAEAGIAGADLKRAVNLAAERQLLTYDTQYGRPRIKAVTR